MFLEVLFSLFFGVTMGASQATLEVDPAMARDRPSFITCTSGNPITRGVYFYTDNDNIQGGCAVAGALCQSSVQGYSVTQNVTSRTTTLIIDSVNCTRETGNWSCRHGNDTESSPHVFIGCNTTKYAPSIDKSRFPSTFIAVKGRQLSVNCSSYTTPGRPSSTSYTWTRPGGSSTSGSTLQVNNVTTSDAGQYTCRASNNFSSSQQGNDSATLQLTVQFAPTVSGQNTSYPVRELSPLNIDCTTYTTKGNPPNTSYTWTTPNNSSSPDHILAITNISRKQAGTYTCRATNTVTPTGESTESGIGEGQFSVDVQYPPDISLSPVVGQRDTNLTLTCTATGNPSNFRFENFIQYWGDQLIQRRGGTQTGDRYSLGLPKVSYEDSGVYVCNVSNSVKPPSDKNTTVTVQAPPVYTNDTNTTNPMGAEVGETAILVQCVYCSPNFTSVSWYFNTTNTTSRRLSTNSSSVSSIPVHLDVYGIQVMVEGFKLVYMVTSFQHQHVGLYTVRVCNSVGCTNSSIELVGSGPPETPLHFTALNSTTDSVTLTWTPQYAGGDYTQEFHVEFRVQNVSGDWSSRVFPLSQDSSEGWVVNGLDSNTGYVFRIKSVSDRKTGNNQSVFSEQIYFSTKKLPKVLPNAPFPLGAIAGGIVGGLTCFVLVAILLVFLMKRKLNKGGDRERLRSGPNGDIVMSAVGGADATTTNNAGVIYAEVKKKKTVTDVYTEVKKPDKRQQKIDGVYENAVPRQYGDDANTYANAGFEGDQPEVKNENPQPQTGRDADGCLYVGIDFGNHKPGKVIIGREKGSYVDIAHGKVGPPPTPDEDEEEEQFQT